MAFAIQPPLAPMLAKSADAIPEGEGWLYEPKWDGFRAIVFRDGDELLLQSRNGRPLGRYFPELIGPLLEQFKDDSVVDGELVITDEQGLDFEALQLRLHPAASRIAKLSRERPATFVAFDLLASEGRDLRRLPFSERRQTLERAWRPLPQTMLTPQTADLALARRWFERFEGLGLEGIVAKRADGAWVAGERLHVKVKHQKTADCVVGGYRLSAKGEGIGSLLLGLYDEAGALHYVGHTSSFNAKTRASLLATLQPLVTEHSFDAGEPGGPSRWAQGRELAWVALQPELVCEVRFDRLQGGKFRHATSFLRWRPDREPRSCTFAQLEAPRPAQGEQPSVPQP